MLIVVTLTPLGIVALMNASRAWISVVGSITVLVLMTASLAVVCRPGSRRAFWLGFAIFGWVYLLLAAVDASFLLTRLANDRLYKVASREGPVKGWENWKTVPPRPYFNTICHYLWSCLLAVIGGFLGRYFYIVQERSSQEPNRRPE